MRTLLLSLLFLAGVSASFAQSFTPYSASVSNAAKHEISFLDVERSVVLPKGENSFELVLPSPDGSTFSVDLTETTAFPASMRAKYPEIKTYRGYAKETGAMVAVSQDPRGISVYVKEVNAPSWQIEPISAGRARMGTTLAMSGDDEYVALACGFEPNEEDETEFTTSANTSDELQSRQAQVVKRRYILALACTGEFGQSSGGTKPRVNAVYAQALNILNGITLSEVALEFELHPENDTLIFTNPDTDPYRVANQGTALLGENPPIINSRIDISTYDIGHVFTNRCNDVGGVVSGRACNDMGKARGVTCNGGNIVRTVERILAHEVAHQFAVGHSWNNCPNSANQRSGVSSFEPGSGSTIMSYQGTCGPDDNVSVITSPVYFNIGAIQQFSDFTRGGFGETCADLITVANNEPEITLPYTNGFTIPQSTPFILEGTAVDPDGDNLTYNWEQYDLGSATSLCDQTASSPLFRSIPPRASGFVRFFPVPNTVRAGGFDCEEQLPRFGRELNFRLTARDDNPAGGGVSWEQVTFNVSDDPTPFRVTSQTSLAETHAAGSFINVTWDVANTNQAPVNCPAVNILLSMDDGLTFPFTLVANTLNDGAEGVTLPASVEGSNARIKVEASNNIFYQLSESRFNIVVPTEPGFTFVPSNTTNFICLPELGQVEFFTAPLLGYDSTLTLRIANTLPAGVVANLSDTQIATGGSSMLSVDFSAFNQTDSVLIVVEATGPNVDTAIREILFDVVSNDFSDLELLGPVDGESGISALPIFTYTPSSRATSHLLQVSVDPLFGLGTTEVVDPDPAGIDLGLLLDINTVYFWRIIPSNRCGEELDAPINAFHTFAATCESFFNSEVLNIPPNVRTTISAPINIPQSGQVSDLNVPIVDIQFAEINDIRVVLEAPDGTQQRLYSRRCGGDRLFTGFDDDSPIEFGCSPLPSDGSLRRPQNPLSIFNGKEIQGEWSLQVEAINPSTGGGEFRNFEIQFCANIVSLPPTLDLNTVEVPLGGFQILERSVISANDADNSAGDLEFIIVTEPTRGHIERYGEELKVGDRWTQADAQVGGVTYVDDDGVVGGTDEMKIVLSDNSGNLIATPTIFFEIDENFVVSTENIEQANIEMLLAPNPTRDFTTVRWGAPSQGGQLNIFDNQGRLIAQQAVANGQREAQLDMSSMARGFYHVNYRGEEGTRTLRLVVQ